MRMESMERKLMAIKFSESKTYFQEISKVQQKRMKFRRFRSIPLEMDEFTHKIIENTARD